MHLRDDSIHQCEPLHSRLITESTECVPFFAVTVYCGDFWLPVQIPLRRPVFSFNERPSGREGEMSMESYTLSGRKRVGMNGVFRYTVNELNPTPVLLRASVATDQAMLINKPVNHI